MTNEDLFELMREKYMEHTGEIDISRYGDLSRSEREHVAVTCDVFNDFVQDYVDEIQRLKAQISSMREPLIRLSLISAILQKEKRVSSALVKELARWEDAARVVLEEEGEEDDGG